MDQFGVKGLMPVECAYCDHRLPEDRLPLACPCCGRSFRVVVPPVIREARGCLGLVHARVYNSVVAIEDRRCLQMLEECAGVLPRSRTQVLLLALEGL